MIKTAIILGVTGQDGSHLAELLLEKKYKVIGVKRRSSTNTLCRLDKVVVNPDFSIVEGDVIDPSSINYLVNSYQPDELFNLSAQSHVHTSFQQPAYTFQVNAVGVLNILEAVRNYSPQTKVYQASTSELWGSNYTIAQDGSSNKYQDEDTHFAPNSPYAIAKLASHHLVRLYRDAYNLFACSGILHNHCGPRRGEEFVTRKITKWIGQFKYWKDNHPNAYFIFDKNDIYIKGRTQTNVSLEFPKLRLGNIDAVRDWSHAKDMVRGMWMMLQQEKPKDYVLCSGIGHSVREFLDISFSYIGIKDWSEYVVIDPCLYRPCEVEFLQGKYNLAKKELGWEPEISFKELVKEMVDYDIKISTIVVDKKIV